MGLSHSRGTTYVLPPNHRVQLAPTGTIREKIIGDKADTPEAANNLLKVLRVLLAYAVDANMIDHNPAIGIKKFRWSKARLALALQ